VKAGAPAEQVPAAKDATPAKSGGTGAVKEGGAKPAANSGAPVDNASKPAQDGQKDKSAGGGKPSDDAAKTAMDKAAPDKTASPAPLGQARRSKSKHKRDGSGADEPELPPGQGPPPPSPLTVSDLRQETNRERGPGGELNAPPRVKLEQLLSEVGKARQSLHDDTLKLEALAGNESARAAEPAAGGDAPTVPALPGQPPPKNPLDVLAKALRGIKPEQAGPIVARLDKGLAATVLLKMPPGDAGKIMGALKPEVAADLATQIAMRAPSSQAGGKR
jgi:hypothetical protein